jgi:hypothetical protein
MKVVSDGDRLFMARGKAFDK